MKSSSYGLRMPPTLKAALPETARTLEQAWQRRKQDLAGWQPTGGWLLDARALVKRAQNN